MNDEIDLKDESMTVTIIGSLKWADDMREAKAFYEGLGFNVHSPADEDVQCKPLIMIQDEWIKNIKAADFIVVIPKDSTLDPTAGKTKWEYEFGESTSYEMAIASSFKKKIVIWMS